MKNENQTTNKYFKYKLTTSMILIAIAVIALCVAGIAVSVYRIIKFGIREPMDALQSPLLIGICIFCIVTVICVLIKSQYIVTDKYYITQHGFIKSKFLIKDITSMVLNTETKKLTIYFGEQFCVLSVCPDWKEDFARALLEVNPNIDYSFTLSDNAEENKK